VILSFDPKILMDFGLQMLMICYYLLMS